jgi:hypothetical protein
MRKYKEKINFGLQTDKSKNKKTGCVEATGSYISLTF